jgi:hypothetical protein
MSINVDVNVKNQGQAPAILTGVNANKPTAGQIGRLYYSTDTNTIYIDNGSAWVVFITGAGSLINVSANYISKENAAGTQLVNSSLYEDPTTGAIALNGTDTTKGKFTVSDNANRVVYAAVSTATSGDDYTTEIRFFGYDGTTINPLGQVYQTNNNQVSTNSFKNSLNLKAFRTDGKIVFIVGGNTSANIKGFINNSGNFILGSLADSLTGSKLQVNGGIDAEYFRLNANVGNIGTDTGYFYIDSAGSTNNVTNIKRSTFIGINPASYYDTSAILQCESTTQGFIAPKMTETQINDIVNPANGLIVYNIDQNVICFYDDSGWRKVNHSNM